MLPLSLFLPLNSRDVLFNHVNFSCSWWLHSHDIWNSIDEVHVLVDSKVENQRHFTMQRQSEAVWVWLRALAAWESAAEQQYGGFLLPLQSALLSRSCRLWIGKKTWLAISYYFTKQIGIFYRQASSHIMLFIFMNCFIQKVSRI